MKRLVLLLLNLLMPMILFAASNDLCFRHFSVEDGLSSNSVRALMQDKYGFLWIGTDEGLNRYDGTTVKLYRLKDRGANEAIFIFIQHPQQNMDRYRRRHIYL